MYIWICIFRCRSAWQSVCLLLRTTPSPPTKSFPIKSSWVKLSGRLPIQLYGYDSSHPLELRVVFESNPLKSKLLVGGLGVLVGRLATQVILCKHPLPIPPVAVMAARVVTISVFWSPLLSLSQFECKLVGGLGVAHLVWQTFQPAMMSAAFYTSIYIYIYIYTLYIYIYMYTLCIYIYIYIEREREICVYIILMYTYVYIYIYIHIYIYIYIIHLLFYFARPLILSR